MPHKNVAILSNQFMWIEPTCRDKPKTFFKCGQHFSMDKKLISPTQVWIEPAKLLIEPERNCFHPQKPGFHQQKLD